MSGETYHNASGSTYNRQIGYVTNGTSTSNLPNRLTYTASTGENWSDIQYTYDSVGNITEINDGTRRYVYTYDALGQLTSETIFHGTNNVPEYLYTYTYDRAGNLVTGGGLENFTANSYSFSYTYGNAQWGDQLTALNGQAITYDKSGNPLSYRGKPLTWTDDQHLQRYYYDSHIWFQYTYNRNGIRTGKNFYDTVKFDYVVDGDKVIAQTWLGNTMLFYYDQNGAPQSVRYNGTLYNYVLNLQGDVVQIRDTDGNLVVQYLYNAWGKVLKVVDADGNTVTSGVGEANPLRYRGYYYDGESGFYYLNSRYYDPEIGRFISPDSTDVMLEHRTDSVVATNLYAYCRNNPVNMTDSDGKLPEWAITGLIHLSISSFWGPVGWVRFYRIKGVIFGAANIYLYSHEYYITQALFNKFMWGGDLSQKTINRMEKAFAESKELTNAITQQLQKVRGNSVKNLHGTVDFNREDLYYAVHSAHYYLTGRKLSNRKWKITVRVEDTFNFDSLWIISQGLSLGSAANDLGLAMQKTGMGRQFDWSVSFTKEYYM